jgi:hypothetical protein
MPLRFQRTPQVCAKGDEFGGRTTHHFGDCVRKKRTDEILRGDFTKIRGTLDLARCKEAIV